MTTQYTKPVVRKNSFVSTTISYKSIIDFESIEDLWCSTIDWNLGNQYWEYDIDSDSVNELKEIVSKKLSFSKEEIENFEWEWSTRKVMADTYSQTYESELYDELFNHIENELENLSYHFEGSKTTDSVHFSEGEYIRVGMTKTEFTDEFYNDYKNFYDTKEDFYDDAERIFEEYIEELVSKYDLEHFDYYGSRVCIYNEWQKNIFEHLDYELSLITVARKKKQHQVKNWIKNKVALIYREN